MTELTSVLVPLVNPNESESMLADLRVEEGQKIQKGDLLAVFESTKSTYDLTAEQDGYVLGLSAKVGDLIKTGETLCYLAENPNQKPPESIVKAQTGTTKIEKTDRRITQPALEYAQKNQIDLSGFPVDQLITKKMLLAMSQKIEVMVDPTTLIIYGGGGHAKALIELIHSEGKYKIAAILDDGIPAGGNLMGVPVLGGGEKLDELRRQGVGLAINAVGGIGNITPRLKVYEKLRLAGFVCPTVIHPRAFIEPTAVIADGGQIFFNAYIGSETRVGFGCIINTGSILSHDCVLEDLVNVSPGAILAGGVKIKERTLIGMGVTINLNVTIGAGCRIGNSAVIKADVPDNCVVRAGAIWPNDSQAK